MNIATQNNDTATRLFDAIDEHFAGDINNRRIAVWGISNEFGEIDEATCNAIEWLIAKGAVVSVHDDSVITEIQTRFGTDVECPEKKWDTVYHADAVVVASRDGKYCNVDAGRLTWSVIGRTLFDVHGTVDRDSLQYSSFTLYTVDAELYDHPVCLPFNANERAPQRTSFAPATLALVG